MLFMFIYLGERCDVDHQQGYAGGRSHYFLLAMGNTLYGKRFVDSNTMHASDVKSEIDYLLLLSLLHAFLVAHLGSNEISYRFTFFYILGQVSNGDKLF